MLNVNFNGYGKYVTDQLYQWDKNRVLSITGLDLDVVPEIHFTNVTMDKAIVRQSTVTDGVIKADIPNSLLQAPFTIIAYVGVYEGKLFKTIETLKIPVITRARPADYTIEDTDEEIYSFVALENAIANMITYERFNAIVADLKNMDSNNKSELSNRITEESKNLASQIAKIVAHNNDTEGNTELIDLRNGADGTVYDSAGQAVRTQIAKILEDILYQKIQIGFKFTPGFINREGKLDTGKNVGNRTITDFIYCFEGDEVIFYGEGGNEYVYTIAFFDKNKTFISGIKADKTGVEQITIAPENSVYARVSSYKNNNADIKVNSNSIIKALNYIMEILEDTDTDIKYQSLKKLDKKIGKNLFDKNNENVTYNSFINDNGSSRTNEYSSAYFSTGFIPIEPSTNYRKSPFENNNVCLAFYDIDYNYIISYKYNETGDICYISPENAKYVRFTGNISNLDKIQFEKGTEITEYEEYTEYKPLYDLKKELDTVKTLLPDSDLSAILPSQLFVCEDHMLPLYYENVMFKSFNDPGDLHINVGKKTSRLQQISLSVGTHKTTLDVNKNFTSVWSKTIDIISSDPNNNKGKTINLLFIGDSFTDIGSYIKETKSLLETDGATVNLIGTCGNSTFKAEGLSGGTIKNTLLDASAGVARIVDVTGIKVIPNTNYPGRTYVDDNGNSWIIRGGKVDSNGNGKIVVTKYGAKESDFDNFPTSGTLTKQSSGEGDDIISYSNPISAYHNPFIDPDTGELDIGTYLTRWNFDTPDVVVIQFTMNDVRGTSTDSDINSVTERFITAVDHIHNSLPDTKIIISVEPYGAFNTNENWNMRKKAVLKWVKQMCETFETDAYTDFCKIAPSYACVDLEYGYSNSKIIPCDRYSDITEISAGDGVHPSTGMLQIADCIYPLVTWFVKN